MTGVQTCALPISGYPDATYLTDYGEYAPDADIGFPTNPKERLDILINTLIDIIKIPMHQNWSFQ